jgi:VPDSG-CTERM motif
LDSVTDRNPNREKAMKKFALVLLLVAGLASPAMAGQIQFLSGYYQSGNGGEFTFQTINPIAGFDPSLYSSLTHDVLATTNTFQTFCIEDSEYIANGYTYTATINPAGVVTGGVGGNPDPVSKGTGWLYSQFAMGTLTGYDYSASRTTAAALQNTIWWLEGDLATQPVNTFTTNVLNAFGGEDAAMADGAEQYGVYALNLTATECAPGYTGSNCQDQLVYVPDGGMTLMLLGGALMGLGALRRKFRA